MVTTDYRGRNEDPGGGTQLTLGGATITLSDLFFLFNLFIYLPTLQIPSDQIGFFFSAWLQRPNIRGAKLKTK